VSAGMLLAFTINKLKFKLYKLAKQEIRQIMATSFEVHTAKNRSVRSVSVMTFKDCDTAKNGRLEIFIFEEIDLF